MKKSILFGALAIFALSAMSIQDVNAQNAEVKAKGKKIETASDNQVKPAATTAAQVPVKQKKGDCCADKKSDQKKGDCCSEKTVKSGEKQLKVDGKKAPQTAVKPNEKKEIKKTDVKRDKVEK